MSSGIEAVKQATCFRCAETKPAREFYSDKTKASGRKSICKACDLEKSRRYYEANRERVAARNRARAVAPARSPRANGPDQCVVCRRPFDEGGAA